METKHTTMKQLPEKWAIKTDDPEFYEWVNANKFRTDCSIVRQHSNMYYIHIGDKFSFWSGESHVLPGYEKITIEQWREAVKQRTVEEYRKSLEEKYSEETGELIGYEAPFDMYKGKYIEVKKGDILTKKDGGYTDKKELTFFPPEWVERDWKPRYKAKEKKRVVKSKWVITKIEFLGDCYEFDIVPGNFTTQADCIEWVKEKGQKKVLYTYHEVDYITE